MLDKLPTYGELSGTSLQRIRTILDFLIENDYLQLSRDEFPVVALTERSDEINKDLKPVSIKLSEQVKAAVSPSSNKKSSGAAVTGGLFDELKKLRTQLASKSHVPAYIIFTDASLQDMCLKLPITIDDFLNVTGVGVSKANKYGRLFTELICGYISTDLSRNPNE